MIDTETPVITILISIALYFTLTALGYYLALAMPSIFLLTPTAMNFALLGVMGLAYTIQWVFGYLISFGPEKSVLDAIMAPLNGLVASILYSIPFFIAIACGAPAFITTSYLSWSAANITLLTYSALIFLSGIILLACNAGDISIRSSEFNARHYTGREQTRKGIERQIAKSFNIQRSAADLHFGRSTCMGS